MKCRPVQFLCVVGAAVALASCGGGSAGDGAADAFQCGSDAGEPSLSQVAVDGGVGIEQYVRAMSIARCNYWSRCSALAPYVVNGCVDALVTFGTWSYYDCPSKTFCGSTIAYGNPYIPSSAALVQAVHAGTLQYDSQGAGQCVAALLAEGCADSDLTEAIPACAGVFTCAVEADAGSGDAADGGADAATSCAGLVSAALLGGYTALLRTCSTAADCAGAIRPQGPYCVAGLCSASQCELSSTNICTAYAQVGQPCLDNAGGIDPHNGGETATESCAPGLACAGTVDGGVGTCVTPQDVGGSCTSTADCKLGLVCACGVCQIPPSAGPCAGGLCKVGVAYCDFDSNVCKPSLQQGDSCPELDSCGPGLGCDVSSDSTCQPLSF